VLKRATNCQFSAFFNPVWQRSHVTAFLTIGKQQHALGKMTTEEWKQRKIESKTPRF
jgi:hypothetical protein